MELFDRPEESRREVLTVSELTARVRAALEHEVGSVWVRGELSSFRVVSSGHGYGTLRDERSQLRLAIFRGALGVLGFRPEEGMEVLARGRVSVYEPRGEYQIICEWLEPVGEGAASIALKQLREKLQAEGLFDPDKKRPLPFLPQTIGVVTSPTGAAVRDVLRVLDHRYANLHVLVSPCKVQGADAAIEIVAALRALEERGGLDVIIVTRGGGSAEDLSAFNDERVVRAIARARVPVISAVGHEIDWTLADLAADLRCATPSAAAERVVREKSSLQEKVGSLSLGLQHAIREFLVDLHARLDQTGRRLVHPRRRLEETAQRLDDLAERVRRAARSALHDRRVRLTGLSRSLFLLARHRFPLWRARLQGVTGRLESLSPLAVIERGYSITRTLPSRAVLRSPGEAPPGTLLEITVRRGVLEARVEKSGLRGGGSRRKC
jgi:exodeoxyribonuclease VII large subunit